MHGLWIMPVDNKNEKSNVCMTCTQQMNVRYFSCMIIFVSNESDMKLTRYNLESNIPTWNNQL